MKLTDEMRAAALDARHKAYEQGESRTDAVFLAGYRMGQRDMRERAAKECDAADERAYPFACAAMIRALPLENANG